MLERKNIHRLCSWQRPRHWMMIFISWSIFTCPSFEFTKTHNFFSCVFDSFVLNKQKLLEKLYDKDWIIFLCFFFFRTTLGDCRLNVWRSLFIRRAIHFFSLQFCILINIFHVKMQTWCNMTLFPFVAVAAAVGNHR